MTNEESQLTYPFSKPPEYGETLEVAPGVNWLRMPLPMSLNHINLYLLEGNNGWTIVDTGIRGEETREHWRNIFATCLRGKPVTQIICTHMHPGHPTVNSYLMMSPLYNIVRRGTDSRPPSPSRSCLATLDLVPIGLLYAPSSMNVSNFHVAQSRCMLW